LDSKTKTDLGPDFGKIYTFLASLFDPNAKGQEETLQEMSPMERETVQVLMHNLTVNLASQQFKNQHGLLMEQYKALNSLDQPQQTSSGEISPSSMLETQPENPEVDESDSTDTTMTPASPVQKIPYSDTDFLIKTEPKTP
jgi:hypothetical protein